jgi:hypothetical protein
MCDNPSLVTRTHAPRQKFDFTRVEGLAPGAAPMPRPPPLASLRALPPPHTRPPPLCLPWEAAEYAGSTIGRHGEAAWVQSSRRDGRSAGTSELLSFTLTPRGRALVTEALGDARRDLMRSKFMVPLSRKRLCMARFPSTLPADAPEWILLWPAAAPCSARRGARPGPWRPPSLSSDDAIVIKR